MCLIHGFNLYIRVSHNTDKVGRFDQHVVCANTGLVDAIS